MGNPAPGTTVLNVNSLTSTIAPAIGSGQPGILFFGAGNITLNSATGRFGIITSDDFVDGIVAQSDGGIKVTSSGNIAVKGLFANGINLLSFSGGVINLVSSSDISLAQGGNGLLAYSDDTVALTSSGAISVSGDGTGINATAGDHVAVTSSGPISITGNGDAIDATDIGGSSSGGGVSVNSSGAISLAGNAAIGINATSESTDPVSITSSSNISLTNGGTGISAASSGAISVDSSGAISVKGGVGAGIAAGSDGTATVDITSSGSISIADDGVAIIGASVGGAANVASSGNLRLGGGGIAISAIGGTDAGVTSSGSISIGGDGNAISAISDSGPASVNSSGDISLGGNGAAIAAFSSSGAANVTSSGTIFIGGNGAVTGIDAEGNLAQVNASGNISLANGGTAISASGANGVSVNSTGPIAIGGNGSAIDASSSGGAATVTSAGNILISGNGTGIAAAGNLAQVNSSGGISLANGGTGIAASGGNGSTVTSSGAISIGGNGTAIAASSIGGTSSVASSGNISIGGSGTGIAAEGNLAQVTSSGGIAVVNGGTGIAATGANGSTVTSSGAITIGGNGTAIAASSIGGTSNVASSSNIFIGGSGSGIAAEGNLVQITSSGSIALVNGGTGISAAGYAGVTVNSSGSISVGGQSSSGISAYATSNAGGVTINSSADISAAGPASIAILAQAQGGNIVANIARGTITGGSGTGAGIELSGGANNTLTNLGTITTSAGLAGTAILGLPSPGSTAFSPPVIGNNVVNNAGTVIGNVTLGPGRNAFNNLPGGTLNSGAVLNLGSGNTLNNNGNFSPGGVGVVQTTALTGNLIQGSAGKLTVDVNPATGQADRINVSGSAQLAGQVAVNPIATAIPTVTTPFTILHANGGVTNQGLTLTGTDLFSSAVVTPELALLDPNDLAFLVAVDFAPPGLNGNQNAIGQNINAIQQAGSSPSFLPVAQALVTIPDLSGLQQAYNQLSPETYADNKIADFYSGLRFANSLMSCNVPDGRYAFIKEGQCVWAQLGGKFLDLNATSGSLGFGENAFVMAGGAEMMVRPGWFASFALGYDHGNINTAGNLAQSQANRAHFGAAIKYNPGPLLLAAAVYGGYGWYTTDRFIDFADFSAAPTSDSNISRVGGQLRAAYLIDRGAWYLKPLIDLNVTRVNLNGFSEQGAGGANLNVSGSGSTVFSASPAVEVGTQTGLQNGVLVRPFAKLGVSAYSNTNFAVAASFAGAPAGVAPFGVASGIDAVTADVAAGADMFLPDSRWALKLAYDARYGARVRDQGVSLKASIRF